QQDNTAQSRVNDGYQLENTFSTFIPGRKGDHDLKVGVQFQYSGSRNINDGNLNGTFSFGRSDGPFDPNDPSTYPERLTIRVPGRAVSYNKATSYAAFVQDKWQINDDLTLSLGVRYDLEIVPVPEVD